MLPWAGVGRTVGAKQWNLAQLATQCVAFSGIGESEIELPEVLEVCDRKPFAKFLAEGAGEVADELAAVFGAGGSALLLLDDAAADLPIGIHHRGIGGGIHLPASLPQDGANVVQQAKGNGWGIRCHNPAPSGLL